jgi:predicted Rossmann-fold nucleotide-binding protein
MKIALISSASHTISESNVLKAEAIANYLHKIGNIEIMTGGSHGVPGLIVQKAKEVGIKTTAYSPDENKDLHASRHDNLDLQYFDEVNHFRGFTQRTLAMFQDADGILVLNGRMGTLSEFAIALEEGKRVGVVTNTGGIADHLEEIMQMAKKDFPEQAFFNDDHIKVIDWLLN